MPPSGFKEDGINGLLAFVQGTYEYVLQKHGSGAQSIDAAIKDIDERVGQTARTLPESLPNYAVDGLKTFMKSNYAELIDEINSGKKQYNTAVKEEMDTIKKYLLQFHILKK
jgi:hypothetical protein